MNNYYDLSSYHLLSVLETHELLNAINSWRNKDIKYVNNILDYKYAISASSSSYKNSYYSLSEIIFIVLNIWNLKKQDEFNILTSDDITTMSIYYKNINHRFHFLFLFN